MMAAADRLNDTNAVARLCGRDTTLFSDDPAVQATVENRLGWLNLAEKAGGTLPQVKRLAEEVLSEGVTDVVLLGMGGSSLASLVIGSVVAPGGARLHVLDTVAPITIRRVLGEVDPETAIYIVASKSGGTVEPNSLYAIFRAAADTALGAEAAGRRFIAITDPGSSLEALASRDGFRAVVGSPADVGGRFSAMSVFGLVPAALTGCDVDVLVERAAGVEAQCARDTANPAVELATFMVDSAATGADKLTVVASGTTRTFGLWVEQLVAESLGKHGKGIVPVVELSDAPHGYGPDRAIVVVRMTGDKKLAEWAATQRGNHPMFEIVLDDAYDVAEEFVRWEYAVALAGVLLGVNPFDEPNVAEAKAATEGVLDGNVESPQPQASVDDVYLTFAGGLPAPAHVERSATTAVGHAVETLRAGDYLAVLAYLPDDDSLFEPLRHAITHLAEKTGAAVALELGPRYLHSTGQLHKGGPGSGVFVMITTRDDVDVEVPGRDWGLKALHVAQAEGDLTTLAAHGRRVLRLDLPDASHGSVAAIANAIADSVGARH